MVRPRVLALQPPADDLAVVVREMREASYPGDVTRAIDSIARLESFRIDLQPAPLGLGQARGAPGLEVWPASGRDEKPVTRHDRAGLEVQHGVGGLLLDRHARVADEDLDPVGLQVWL